VSIRIRVSVSVVHFQKNSVALCTSCQYFPKKCLQLTSKLRDSVLPEMKKQDALTAETCCLVLKVISRKTDLMHVVDTRKGKLAVTSVSDSKWTMKIGHEYFTQAALMAISCNHTV